MRQGTYLNVILTVHAVLLAGVLWTQVASGPILEQTATAQVGSKEGVGVPNAADQRQKMLEALRDIKASVDSTRKLVESGKLKVEVSNFDQARKVEVTNIDQLRR
jgi:hypothetical protein